MVERPRFEITWGGRRLVLGPRTVIMGVLNVTPDSFSDGGRFFSLDKALSQARKMVADGADIIDIGGESTRPFAEAVDTQEELRRVIPLIEALVADGITQPISIDTAKAEVARAALEAGAAIINDVSALNGDADMASVAAEYGVPVILMHMKGTPRTMQVEPAYDDLVAEIAAFLSASAAKAEKAGIDPARIIVDPGIGFGKTMAHNLHLIRELHQLQTLGRPLLMGTSRKRFIRSILAGGEAEDMDPLDPTVAVGTQATVAASIMNGAHIVRVHDIAATRATAKLVDAICAR